MGQVFGQPADVVSAVAAIAAVVISAIAFGLALWTAWLQRVHNRLSVRPLAEIMVRDMEGHIRVKLHNHGTGPLVVEKLRVQKLGGRTFDSLVEAMPDAHSHWTFFAGNVDGRSVPAGGWVNLLELRYEGSDDDFASEVRSVLQHLVVRVSYFDIYRKKMPAYRKSLEWFGRTL